METRGVPFILLESACAISNVIIPMVMSVSTQAFAES